MSLDETEVSIRFKVGVFTLLGLALIGAMTVFINDKPFWWRSCQLVHISIEDATGLKEKSPVRSLGIQIGFLKSVELSETHVKLGICITAPVQVLDSTRAFLRSEGFLGDKFIELKPVKFTGESTTKHSGILNLSVGFEHLSQFFINHLIKINELIIPSAHADLEGNVPKKSKEIPVGEQSEDFQKAMEKVNVLLEQLGGVAKNLNEAIDPNELKKVINQLNKTLENASKTLSPEGGLTVTARRTLLKLEDTVEQLRQVITRINRGEGSVGRVINDPLFAAELEKALRNLNKLLNKADSMRFIVDVGGEQLAGYEGTRGWFKLGIWPTPSRYYLLGVASDPRGKMTSTKTTTDSNGASTVTKTTVLDKGGILLTALLGKVLWRRLDLAIGFLYGDAAARVNFYFGGYGEEDRFQLSTSVFGRSQGIDSNTQINVRSSLVLYPSTSPYLKNIYISGGLETFRRVEGKVAYTLGAGISFDDDDIKLLFAFK